MGGVGPFRFRPRGSDRNTTNATAPPKTRRAQIFGPPAAWSSQPKPTGPGGTRIGRNHPPGRPQQTACLPVHRRSAQFSGARPHQCRLPWGYDSGREDSAIRAAAEWWPLWAATWPRPIRLWRPTCPAAGFAATAAAAPTHGPRRRRHRFSGRIGGISAGSRPDYPLQQQRLEQRRSSCWRPSRIVEPGVH